MVNDINVVVLEDESDEAESPLARAAEPAAAFESTGAVAAEEIIATAAEEDSFLTEFVKANKIRPNAKGKVTIVGDLENKLSNEVERHIPKIKSQLKDLKKRLIILSRTI